MRQQQTKNIPLRVVLAQVLHDPLHWYSLGLNQLKLISNIDNVIVYNTTHAQAYAAEVRGGMRSGGLANHNTLDQLTNLCPLRISEGGAS